MSQTTLPAPNSDPSEGDRFVWWPFAVGTALPVFIILSGVYYDDVTGHLVPWYDVWLIITTFLMLVVAVGLSISVLIERRWRTAISMAAPLIIVPIFMMLSRQFHDDIRWQLRRAHFVDQLEVVELMTPDRFPAVAWALGDSWEQWLEHHKKDPAENHPHELHEQERRPDMTGCKESFQRLEARYYLHKYTCAP
jgi:hypothetical protein